jgi:hypothetical protein
MTYYRRLEKGLEEWSGSFEEILDIIEQQDELRKTIHFKSETCCDKIKKVLNDMKEIKNTKNNK